jgi:hypothetical protein
MITLFLTVLNAIDIPLIIGYMVSIAEIILVFMALLTCFVPKESKFGKWLNSSVSHLASFLQTHKHKEDANEHESSKKIEASKEDDEGDNIN